MNEKPMTKTWRQYEAGKAYKRRIGLYETVRRNERFYRGDQWAAGEANELPKPVFNYVRRLTDYLVCTVADGGVSISYSDACLPYLGDEGAAAARRAAVELMSRNAAYRWEACHMDRLVYRALTDAALSGDGVFYCYWDQSLGAGAFKGDICTEVIDNLNLFVADVNRADIQSQEYIILSGRADAEALRREAREAGAGADVLESIRPDNDCGDGSGELSRYELENEEGGKTTYLLKFWRENGRVVFEKSVREAVIRRVETDLKRYPVACFNWYPTKNSFHGTSPVTAMVPNQKFINRAYAMVMKHMTDTAFSKVIYDKTRIPEWNNEVGQAIAAVGSGNMEDVVKIVGVGQMQDDYMALIDAAVSATKDMMGATDAALGSAEASNTSAILALQQASRLSMEQIAISFAQGIEDLANIWADMMCAYYPDTRLLPYREESAGEGGNAGRQTTGGVDFGLLREGLLSARVEVGATTRYSAAGTQTLLDHLLADGHITFRQYLERLPAGILPDRAALIAQFGEKKEPDGPDAVPTDND